MGCVGLNSSHASYGGSNNDGDGNCGLTVAPTAPTNRAAAIKAASVTVAARIEAAAVTTTLATATTVATTMVAPFTA